MKKNDRAFSDIELIKERQRLRILQQELKIKASVKELGQEITGAAVAKRLQENLFSGSGLAFKLGFMAVSLISERIRRRRNK